ncbi:P-type DNA transfer protein VirB5 [Ancylobacter sp. FA202]|uniref:P-type DNA transfer protein VirB5 n=1 Tax=Ancylobacter sp. FA202 TaxID=1111106 RepID=UPI0003622940|nr:P-type DNA transfer protein VirB5 [Ancylobacter sp. FA202]
MSRLRLVLIVTTFLSGSLGASAQGIPVLDTTAIAKQVEQIAQLKSQLDTLKEQLAQGQALFDSMNGVTNMSNVAGLLNDPEIRNALPGNFSEVEGLLQGNGSGAFGSSAQRHLDSNSSYQTNANDFYAQELAKVQKQNAGQLSLGEQMYEAATKRVDGLEELRKQISKSSDAKEVAALSARIQSESALLQTDTLRMQALKMVQDAQIKVDEQRARENWRQKLDNMEKSLK